MSEIERLREALECARIKLSRYREQHGDLYIGGVAAEYDAVVKRIDAALVATPTAERGEWESRDELETRLWSIIDRDRLGDVPSDVVGAVARLVTLAKDATQARQEGIEGWQPIETAPLDMTEVIGLDERTGTILRTWYFAPSSQTFGWCALEKRHRSWKPTHWTPLPTPQSQAAEPTDVAPKHRPAEAAPWAPPMHCHDHASCARHGTCMYPKFPAMTPCEDDLVVTRIAATASSAPSPSTLYAQRLRDLRSGKGVSLQIAADGIGCSKAHLWDLESGGSTNPTLDLLSRTAAYFGTSVAFLAGETATPVISVRSQTSVETVWQPIASAPRDGTHVLIAFGSDHSSVGVYRDNDSDAHPWKFMDSNGSEPIFNGARDDKYGPTHWMPLPAFRAAPASPPAETMDAQEGEK